MPQIVPKAFGHIVGVERPVGAVAQNGIGPVVGSHHHIALIEVEDIEGVSSRFGDIGVSQ